MSQDRDLEGIQGCQDNVYQRSHDAIPLDEGTGSGAEPAWSEKYQINLNRDHGKTDPFSTGKRGKGHIVGPRALLLDTKPRRREPLVCGTHRKSPLQLYLHTSSLLFLCRLFVPEIKERDTPNLNSFIPSLYFPKLTSLLVCLLTYNRYKVIAREMGWGR